MSGEFGTGKTIFVLAIVIGCFAVLWPKIFYPMLMGSVKQPLPTRQELQWKNGENTEYLNKLCFLLEEAMITSSSPRVQVNCLDVLNQVCGLHKTGLSETLLQDYRLGKESAQNLTNCLHQQFHLSPQLVAAAVPPPSRIRHYGSIPPHARQERPSHLQPDVLHPALREKGRALPQRTIEKQARPGPMPGIRPPMGGGGGGTAPPPQSKGSGAMGIIMPLYTVGIVIFFIYTIMKVLFKKGGDEDKTPKLKDFHLDPEYRKYVFAEEYLDNSDQSLKDHLKRQDRDASRRRRLGDPPETKIEETKDELKNILKMETNGRKLEDEQMDQLRRRLEETERAMERLMSQMGSVTDKLTAAKITEVLSQAQAQAKMLKEQTYEIGSEDDMTTSECLTTTYSEDSSFPAALQRHLLEHKVDVTPGITMPSYLGDVSSKKIDYIDASSAASLRQHHVARVTFSSLPKDEDYLAPDPPHLINDKEDKDLDTFVESEISDNVVTPIDQIVDSPTTQGEKESEQALDIKVEVDKPETDINLIKDETTNDTPIEKPSDEKQIEIEETDVNKESGSQKQLEPSEVVATDDKPIIETEANEENKIETGNENVILDIAGNNDNTTQITDEKEDSEIKTNEVNKVADTVETTDGKEILESNENIVNEIKPPENEFEEKAVEQHEKEEIIQDLPSNVELNNEVPNLDTAETSPVLPVQLNEEINANVECSLEVDDKKIESSDEKVNITEVAEESKTKEECSTQPAAALIIKTPVSDDESPKLPDPGPALSPVNIIEVDKESKPKEMCSTQPDVALIINAPVTGPESPKLPDHELKLSPAIKNVIELSSPPKNVSIKEGSPDIAIIESTRGEAFHHHITDMKNADDNLLNVSDKEDLSSDATETGADISELKSFAEDVALAMEAAKLAEAEMKNQVGVIEMEEPQIVLSKDQIDKLNIQEPEPEIKPGEEIKNPEENKDKPIQDVPKMNTVEASLPQELVTQERDENQVIKQSVDAIVNTDIQALGNVQNENPCEQVMTQEDLDEDRLHDISIQTSLAFDVPPAAISLPPGIEISTQTDEERSLSVLGYNTSWKIDADGKETKSSNGGPIKAKPINEIILDAMLPSESQVFVQETQIGSRPSEDIEIDASEIGAVPCVVTSHLSLSFVGLSQNDEVLEKSPSRQDGLLAGTPEIEVSPPTSNDIENLQSLSNEIKDSQSVQNITESPPQEMIFTSHVTVTEAKPSMDTIPVGTFITQSHIKDITDTSSLNSNEDIPVDTSETDLILSNLPCNNDMDNNTNKDVMHETNVVVDDNTVEPKAENTNIPAPPTISNDDIVKVNTEDFSSENNDKPVNKDINPDLESTTVVKNEIEHAPIECSTENQDHIECMTTGEKHTENSPTENNINESQIEKNDVDLETATITKIETESSILCSHDKPLLEENTENVACSTPEKTNTEDYTGESSLEESLIKENIENNPQAQSDTNESSIESQVTVVNTEVSQSTNIKSNDLTQDYFILPTTEPVIEKSSQNEDGEEFDENTEIDENINLSPSASPKLEAVANTIATASTLAALQTLASSETHPVELDDSQKNSTSQGPNSLPQLSTDNIVEQLNTDTNNSNLQENIDPKSSPTERPSLENSSDIVDSSCPEANSIPIKTVEDDCVSKKAEQDTGTNISQNDETPSQRKYEEGITSSSKGSSPDIEEYEVINKGC